MENVNFGGLWYTLADTGIQLELDLKYLEIYATTLEGSNPEARVKLMEQVQKHFDPKIKSEFEKLTDEYKQRIGNNTNEEIIIRTETKQTVMGKQSGRSASRL